jgi:hypothetical protein
VATVKEELMNQPNSSEEPLMRKRARDSNDGDTSSTELEHDSVRTPTGICSDDGSDDDEDFWM